jgi:hypothetical protein
MMYLYIIVVIVITIVVEEDGVDELKLKRLEALPVDNAWARLIVFLLGDPHLLEGGQGGQDGTTDPDGVFTLWGSNDLDLNGGWSQGSDFLLHSVSNTRVHGGTTGQDSVGVQVLTDVDIALHDGVVDGLVDSARFHSQEGWLEEGLWATETFITNGDDLTIRQFIGFLKGSGSGSGGHFLFEVQSYIAELLLDVTDNFSLSSGGERVATLGEDLHEVVSEVSAGQVQTEDGMRKGITFIDGDGVRNTITRVQDDTGGTTGSVQGQNGLDGNIHSGAVECLKHDLGHLFPVSFWVKRSLSEENGMFLWGNSQFIVEGVMPDLFHVIPVGDDSVLNGVFQSEDTSLGLSLITYIAVLLTHTDHDTLMSWATDDGWENSTGSVIPGESGLAHTGSIVYYQSGNIVVTHFVWF